MGRTALSGTWSAHETAAYQIVLGLSVCLYRAVAKRKTLTQAGEKRSLDDLE